MGRVAFAVGLTVIWVLAWGSPSVANIVGGAAVATLLLVVAPDTWPSDRPSTVRPLALLRFVGYALVKSLEANLVIAREVLVPNPRLHTGVIAVPLPDCSDELMTILSNVMALSPGLLPIELDRDPTVLYVHVLHVDDLEASRRQVARLADLAYAALGSDVAVATLRRQRADEEGRS